MCWYTDWSYIVHLLLGSLALSDLPIIVRIAQTSESFKMFLHHAYSGAVQGPGACTTIINKGAQHQVDDMSGM